MNTQGLSQSESILEDELRLYAESGINVLFIGKHGVGKTAIVKKLFEEMFGDRWRYFSASTMDPWVDFVGVPQKVENPDGSAYLELIRPAHFQAGQVEALFMDELKRSKDKIRNAVMELIQFRSINGVPFPNLKMVWAAINPDDDDDDTSYDVERLDPAQEDRFPIQIVMPYEPNLGYFTRMYGDSGVGACEWWYDLTEEQQDNVSPRRLEYAIEIYQKGGNLQHVLRDDTLNLTSLRSKLVSGSIVDKLKDLYEADDDVVEKAFNQIEFEKDAIDHIKEDQLYVTRFTPFMQKEHISQLVTQDDGKYAEIMIHNTPAEVISPILISILTASNLKRNINKTIRTLASERGLDLTSEQNFRTAISDGIAQANKQNSERYRALQNVSQVFDERASLEAYEDCVLFIAKIIYFTAEASLHDNSKPYNQLSIHILKACEKCLQRQNTSVADVWNNLKHSKFGNAGDDRINKVEKYLSSFLVAEEI